jgi:hypothetical protein
MGQESIRCFVGKYEVRKPLGRARHRWKDNIKVDLRQIGWGGKDWIDLAQDRDQWRAHVNKVINYKLHRMLLISLMPEWLLKKNPAPWSYLVCHTDPY